MLPSIWPGDVLLVQQAEFADLQCGGMLLYACHGGFVLHRIVEKKADAVITRGDAFAEDDEPVLPFQVLGKLAIIERGRARIVPKEKLNCPQRILRFAIRHCPPFLAFVLRLNSLRLRISGRKTRAGYVEFSV
jgi:hypothetical protein